MALPGKDAVVQVRAATSSAWNTVADINDFTMSQSGNNLDVTAFSTGGASFMERIQGLKDVSWDISGFWRSTDTNGQVAVRNAWLNDTALYVQVLPDGSSGFWQQVRVSSFDISATVDRTVDLSASLEGTGTVSASTS